MVGILTSSDFTTYVVDLFDLISPGVVIAISLIGILWATRILIYLLKYQSIPFKTKEPDISGGYKNSWRDKYRNESTYF